MRYNKKIIDEIRKGQENMIIEKETINLNGKELVLRSATEADAEMLINLFNEAFEIKNGYFLQSAVPVPKTEEAEQMPLPITDETEIQNGSTDDADIGEQYNPYALAIVVALMAAAVALTLALTKKKN